MDSTQRFRHLRNAARVSGIRQGPRDVGYVTEFALHFGARSFDCSGLEGQHVSNELVRSNYSVGEYPKNRTLTDCRVSGARLPQLGLLQHNNRQETFQLTHAGAQLAVSELRNLAAS